MSNSLNPRRSPLEYLMVAVKGFCMGAADVVPGVSGGTMAFILGIYEELLRSIASFDLTLVKLISTFRFKDALDHAAWRFLLVLGIGVLTAVFSLARALSWLLQNQPVLIWSFFFGLILASVVTVSRHLKRWSAVLAGWVGSGAVFSYLLVGLMPASTPEAGWFLFLSGAMAICATILPGISGAFVMVLLGKYQFLLNAVNNRDIWPLFLVAAGAAVGLLTFVRFVNWFFEKYHDATVAVLTGLMLGSLRKVWPWKETLATIKDAGGGLIPVVQANVPPSSWGGETMLALALIALGAAVVLVLDFFARRTNAPR